MTTLFCFFLIDYQLMTTKQSNAFSVNFSSLLYSIFFRALLELYTESYYNWKDTLRTSVPAVSYFIMNYINISVGNTLDRTIRLVYLS